jgi:hypothetical protein
MLPRLSESGAGATPGALMVLPKQLAFDSAVMCQLGRTLACG